MNNREYSEQLIDEIQNRLEENEKKSEEQIQRIQNQFEKYLNRAEKQIEKIQQQIEKEVETTQRDINKMEEELRKHYIEVEETIHRIQEETENQSRTFEESIERMHDQLNNIREHAEEQIENIHEQVERSEENAEKQIESIHDRMEEYRNNAEEKVERIRERFEDDSSNTTHSSYSESYSESVSFNTTPKVEQQNETNTVQSLMERFDKLYNERHAASTIGRTFVRNGVEVLKYSGKLLPLSDVDEYLPRKEWLQTFLDEDVTINNFNDYCKVLNARDLLMRIKNKPDVWTSGLFNMPPTDDWESYKEEYIGRLTNPNKSPNL